MRTAVAHLGSAPTALWSCPIPGKSSAQLGKVTPFAMPSFDATDPAALDQQP